MAQGLFSIVKNKFLLIVLGGNYLLIFRLKGRWIFLHSGPAQWEAIYIPSLLLLL